MFTKTQDPDSDITLLFTILNSRRLEFIAAMSAPAIVGCGLLSIFPMIVAHPVTSITGKARSCMESCSLTILPYCLATFAVDVLIFTALTTVMWCIYMTKFM